MLLWGRGLRPASRYLSLLHRTFATQIHNNNSSNSSNSSSATTQKNPITWVPFRTACVRLLALNDLRDQKGALKRPKRVGRGPGSGLGQTCGKGTKGTYQRRRLHKRGFEGAHTTLWKATPKWGEHDKKLRTRPLSLPLDRLLMWVREGRLDTSKPLTIKVLSESRVLRGRKIRHGIQVTERGWETFQQEYAKLGLPPPQLTVTDATPRAKEMIEAVGGSVQLIWMARVPLRAHLVPERFPILPQSNGIPPKRLWKKYGYQHPEDRYYRGADKSKTFASRIIQPEKPTPEKSEKQKDKPAPASEKPAADKLKDKPASEKPKDKPAKPKPEKAATK